MFDDFTIKAIDAKGSGGGPGRDDFIKVCIQKMGRCSVVQSETVRKQTVKNVIVIGRLPFRFAVVVGRATSGEKA